MPHIIHYSPALCGAGKSYAALTEIGSSSSSHYLYAAPSKILCDQFYRDAVSLGISVVMVYQSDNGVLIEHNLNKEINTNRTVGTALAKLLNNKHAQLTICTQSALKQLGGRSIKKVKSDYTLICDEFSNVDHYYSVAMAHTHQHYSPYLTTAPYNSTDLLRVTLTQGAQLPPELVDPKKYRDDTQKLFAPVLDHLLRGDTVLATKETYTSQIINGCTNVNRKDPAVHFLAIEKPSYLLGWAKTTVLSANFDHSLAFHLLQQFYGIRLVLDQDIDKSLRFAHHTNGQRLTIKYLDTGSTSMGRYDEVVGSHKESNFSRIDDFAHSQLSDDYVIVANNKHTLQRYTSREELPVISHGLNSFQHIHQVAFLAALNKSTMHIKILKSLSIADDLIGAHIHETVYQAVMRCSLRDPSATEPVTVFITDKPRAEELSRKFNGSTLVALQLTGYTGGKPFTNSAIAIRKRFRKHQQALTSSISLQGGGKTVPQISIDKKNGVQKFPASPQRTDTLDLRGNYPLSIYEYFDPDSEYFIMESIPWRDLEIMECDIQGWFTHLMEPAWASTYRRLGKMAPEFLVTDDGHKPFDENADSAFMLRVWVASKRGSVWVSVTKSTDSYGDDSGYKDLVFEDPWAFQKYLNKCSVVAVKDKLCDELSAAIQSCVYEPYFDGYSRKKYDPYHLEAEGIECVTRKFHSLMFDFDDTEIDPQDLPKALSGISHSIMSSFSNQVSGKGWRYRVVVYLPYIVSYERYITLYNHIVSLIKDAGYTHDEIALDDSKSATKAPEAMYLLPCTNNDHPQNHICINSWDHYPSNKKKDRFFKELIDPSLHPDTHISLKPKSTVNLVGSSARQSRGVLAGGSWSHSGVGADVRDALVADKIKEMQIRESGTGNQLFFKVAMSLSRCMGHDDLTIALQKIASSDSNAGERLSEIPSVISSVAKYRSQAQSQDQEATAAEMFL